MEQIQATIDRNERLTPKQVSQQFSVPLGTLAYWRMQRYYDKTKPRFWKLGTKKVFYVRCEIEEDLKGVCV